MKDEKELKLLNNKWQEHIDKCLRQTKALQRQLKDAKTLEVKQWYYLEEVAAVSGFIGNAKIIMDKIT